MKMISKKIDQAESHLKNLKSFYGGSIMEHLNYLIKDRLDDFNNHY